MTKWKILVAQLTALEFLFIPCLFCTYKNYLVLISSVPFFGGYFMDVYMWFSYLFSNFYVAYYSWAIVFIHLRVLFFGCILDAFFHFVYGVQWMIVKYNIDIRTQKIYIIYVDLRRFTAAAISGIHKYNINACIKMREKKTRPYCCSA